MITRAVVLVGFLGSKIEILKVCRRLHEGGGKTELLSFIIQLSDQTSEEK